MMIHKHIVTLYRRATYVGRRLLLLQLYELLVYIYDTWRIKSVMTCMQTGMSSEFGVICIHS